MSDRFANPTAIATFEALLENPARFPFGFTYGGHVYSGFGDASLRLLSREDSCKKTKKITILRYLLCDTLTVTLCTARYPSHGAAEWTVWFENTGREESEILGELHTALSLSGKNPVLRGILGDHVNQYRPYTADLLREEVHFRSESGRPTHEFFPYFDLVYGACGMMLAIGWAGTWAADFTAEGEQVSVCLRSTPTLHTRLRPGEKIRSALFVALPYPTREEQYATNLWRDWFVSCNLPRESRNDEPLRPLSSCCLAKDTGRPNSDGSISESYETWRPSLEKMFAEHVHVDFRWFDAGWYAAPDGSSPESDWWGTVGAWELDRVKWPDHTFRESTDYARAHGMRTLMWFEPERVTYLDALVSRHGYDRAWAITDEDTGVITNNIGDPACLAWTSERICRVLRENRVELYREDNNSDPGALWRKMDAMEGEDRVGITECRFVQAHYQLWDEIISCTSSLEGGCHFVDSCAAGGGRNDLESLRRGVPLLRSDADRSTSSLRLSMTTSFCRWIPFCGASTKELTEQGRVNDLYTWRASYLPALNVSQLFVHDPEQNFDMLRHGLAEWELVKKYLLRDMYVLTPWHPENDRTSFTAYAFYDPDEGRGVLFLFRMEACRENTLTVSLPFAADGVQWHLRDFDTGITEPLTPGGVHSFTLDRPRTARLLWIEKPN